MKKILIFLTLSLVLSGCNDNKDISTDYIGEWVSIGEVFPHNMIISQSESGFKIDYSTSTNTGREVKQKYPASLKNNRLESNSNNGVLSLSDDKKTLQTTNLYFKTLEFKRR